MSLSLYMDHHVRRAVTEGLRRRGIDVLTAFEDSTDQFPDDQLLARATSLSRVVVTSDADFLAIATDWQTAGREFSGVIYVPEAGLTIGETVHDLELICGAMWEADLRNLVTWLPI